MFSCLLNLSVASIFYSSAILSAFNSCDVLENSFYDFYMTIHATSERKRLLFAFT